MLKNRRMTQSGRPVARAGLARVCSMVAVLLLVGAVSPAHAFLGWLFGGGGGGGRAPTRCTPNTWSAWIPDSGCSATFDLTGAVFWVRVGRVWGVSFWNTGYLLIKNQVRACECAPCDGVATQLSGDACSLTAGFTAVWTAWSIDGCSATCGAGFDVQVSVVAFNLFYLNRLT